MREVGKVLFDDTLTKHPVVEEAKRSQEQKQRQQQEQAAARAARPLLNKHTYPELYARWVGNGGGLLPKCRRCREYTIHWDEPAHVCEGYKPQFEDAEVVEARYEARKDERRARREAEVEAIREARRNGTLYDECREDEPEEDWFDEDESYEEEDGDPMWD